jgi:hypothetical protein
MNMMTALALLVSLTFSGFVFYQNSRLTDEIGELKVKVNDIWERAFTVEVGATGQGGAALNIHGDQEPPSRIYVPSDVYCSEIDPEEPGQQTFIRFDDRGGLEVWGLHDGRGNLSNNPDARGTYTIAGMYIFVSIETGDGMNMRRRVDIEFYDKDGRITHFRAGDQSFSVHYCR